jgi:hypothetical protein
MSGVGTSGTLTGLVFACGFSVDGRDCKLYLEMPYWHSQSTATWDCSGYEMIGINVPSGKVINQKVRITHRDIYHCHLYKMLSRTPASRPARAASRRLLAPAHRLFRLAANSLRAT